MNPDDRTGTCVRSTGNMSNPNSEYAIKVFSKPCMSIRPLWKNRTANDMVRVDDFSFAAGGVYLFAVCPRGTSACGVFGIFDRFDGGRIRLEALWYGGGDLRYDECLPPDYRYVRAARSEEIRDFYFLYGYSRCRTECR